MASLAVCMIMENEEGDLPNCLDSIKGLFDELIIVDHGSKDSSIRIAKEYGAIIRPFEWCDDFAKSRNESIKEVKSDWIFYIDADEVLASQDVDKIKKLISNANEDTWGFLCDQRNYANDSSLRGWRKVDDYNECKGPGFFVSKIIRLFRNKEVIKFQNRVHEIVDNSILKNNKKILDSGVQIHHYGYLKKEEDLAQKREKYLRLGLKQCFESPDDARPRYEIAKIYKNMGQLEKAKEHIEKVIKIKPDYKLAFTNYGEILTKLGNVNEAIEAYKRAIAFKPNNENAYVNLGVIYAKQKNIKLALTCLNDALKVNPVSPSAFNNLILVLLQNKQYKSAKQAIDLAIERTGLEKFKKTRDLLKTRIPKLFEN